MPRPSTPVSANDQAQRGTGCLRLFLLPFLAAGCFFFYMLAIQPLWGVWRARSWPAVPCRIVSSEVKSHRGSDSTTYKVLINYEYQLDGRRYQSDQHSFFTINSSGYSGKRAVVDRYPPGLMTTCYVNPLRPEEAVIDRGVNSTLWWGLFPLPFLAIGLLAFAPSRWFANSSSRNGPLKSTGTGKLSARRKAELHPHDAFAGPTTLSASGSRFGKLIGLIFVALFWNGIVSVFVWKVWEGFSRNRPEWFLVIFLIPFVLVGVCLIFGVGYAFLGLFNPQVNLVVSSATVPLGGDVEVQWSFKGSSRRVRDLKILLEGAERATYRRGTDTTTDDYVFSEIPIIESADPAEIRAGSQVITIPSHLMHTFKAPNNEISWKIKVTGSVPWFPDVKEEFPLTVVPHEHSSL